MSDAHKTIEMMASIEEYLGRAAEQNCGRAVVVGKGPSCSEFDHSLFRDHFVVGLNEVALRIQCDAAFVIDEDIPLSHGEALTNAVQGAMIVPRVMHHVARRVGGLTIYAPNFQQDTRAPWRQAAGAKLRLFNLSTAAEADPALGGVYPAFSFSAPTLANLLAACGFSEIVLCGVDGGSMYAPGFKAYEHKKLGSIQNDFNVQFSELRRIRERHGTRFSSVRCPQAHVLIGTEPEQCLATEVLRWSLDSNTFLALNYLQPGDGSRHLYQQGAIGTPFSLQRLELPALAGHMGRGLYVDSDMLVFDDVYDLFNMDLQGNVLLSCQPTPGRAPQYSVFLVDNARARWDAADLARQYRQGVLSYEALMHRFDFAQPKAALIDRRWNSLETYEAGVTGNLHLTDMDRQPWLSTWNPNAAVWCEALLSALQARPAVREALELSLMRGWVRPSLRWQVEHGQADPWALPRAVRSADDAWVPPHVALRFAAMPGWLTRAQWRLTNQWRHVKRSRWVRGARRVRDTVVKVAQRQSAR